MHLPVAVLSLVEILVCILVRRPDEVYGDTKQSLKEIATIPP
jgi:hypothetical protein